MMSDLQESVRYFRGKVSLRPRTAVVLGSGLGGYATKLKNKILVDSRDVPHFPVPGIEGHSGKLVFGRVSDSRSRTGPFVLLFVGRSHYYETGNLKRVTYYVRLAHELGIKNLILTNAAGGVNPMFSPGDLMLITGQVNLTFRAAKLGLRRRLTTSPYDANLTNMARTAASRSLIPMKEGIYCGLTGPSYETAAEVEMLRRLGVDAVGMSTVHEAIVASQLGMWVLGISLITNLATGLAAEPATHEEVIRVAREAEKRFKSLLTAILRSIGS
jgi:purine-nucleoside phosphorylase